MSVNHIHACCWILAMIIAILAVVITAAFKSSNRLSSLRRAAQVGERRWCCQVVSTEVLLAWHCVGEQCNGSTHRIVVRIILDCWLTHMVKYVLAGGC